MEGDQPMEYVNKRVKIRTLVVKIVSNSTCQSLLVRLMKFSFNDEVLYAQEKVKAIAKSQIDVKRVTLNTLVNVSNSYRHVVVNTVSNSTCQSLLVRLGKFSFNDGGHRSKSDCTHKKKRLRNRKST